jgi:ribosomal-protein-alanine N-acetyltransferase
MKISEQGSAMPVPVIETARLILRPLRPGDEPAFLALAGDWDVARMTSDIPHPLTAAQAKAWLTQTGNDVRFAVDFGGAMIGSVGYFRRRSGAAELGFWLGRDSWGLGFGTEAAEAVIRFGFGEGHAAFSSAHFVDNPASGRVLAKLGFEPDGRSTMWCAARGIEVDAITLLLSRERAEQLHGPPATAAAPTPRWPLRISRWLGAAQG